jgi:hypothetical protein
MLEFEGACWASSRAVRRWDLGIGVERNRRLECRAEIVSSSVGFGVEDESGCSVVIVGVRIGRCFFGMFEVYEICCSCVKNQLTVHFAAFSINISECINAGSLIFPKYGLRIIILQSVV